MISTTAPSARRERLHALTDILEILGSLPSAADARAVLDALQLLKLHGHVEEMMNMPDDGRGGKDRP